MTLQKQIVNSLANKTEELQNQGYCILKGRFANSLVDNCRLAFLPILQTYLKHNGHLSNRGANRHFIPMPFEPSCFSPEFFFDAEILTVAKNVMGDKIVADQWGCDFPLLGSSYQTMHVDYQRPLFHETPNLELPFYMLVVSFVLTKITQENGALELAPGTHRMPREEATNAVETSKINMLPINMDIGDVLIRHPWTLHRGTPNNTDTPRLLVTIRYVRNWYCDSSREVNSIPTSLWKSLTHEQRNMLRFPVQIT